MSYEEVALQLVLKALDNADSASPRGADFREKVRAAATAIAAAYAEAYKIVHETTENPTPSKPDR